MTERAPRPRFAELLAVLVEHEVAFVIVGGAAAVLAGVWYATDDLDIVPDYEPANLKRLVAALAALDGRHDDPAGRTILPDLARLRSSRMSLFVTRLGRLDVLRAVGREREYADLVPRSELLDLDGLAVRSASLELLIEAKEIAGRAKDREHLLLLREALRLRDLDSRS
jgi:hypothetical protein